jgi:hypothetical protein
MRLLQMVEMMPLAAEFLLPCCTTLRSLVQFASEANVNEVPPMPIIQTTRRQPGSHGGRGGRQVVHGEAAAVQLARLDINASTSGTLFTALHGYAEYTAALKHSQARCPAVDAEATRLWVA